MKHRRTRVLGSPSLHRSRPGASVVALVLDEFSTDGPACRCEYPPRLEQGRSAGGSHIRVMQVRNYSDVLRHHIIHHEECEPTAAVQQPSRGPRSHRCCQIVLQDLVICPNYIGRLYALRDELCCGGGNLGLSCSPPAPPRPQAAGPAAPHTGHQPVVPVISMAYSTSPSRCETENTAMPSNPSIAVALLFSIT